MLTKTRVQVLDEIMKERDRQEELVRTGKFKHSCASHQLSNEVKFLVIGEEFGEVARAILQLRKLVNDEKRADLKKELIQLVAVGFAWLEALTEQEKGR